MLMRIIKNWLRRRLGIVINILPEHFLKAIRDGTLLAQILASYDIITADDLQCIEETTESAIAFANYNDHLKRWLQLINIDISEHDIYDIISGESTTAVTLFYDIYLELERERGRQWPKSPQKGLFQVKVVHEGTPIEIPNFPPNALCDPIIKQWDIVNWEKDHLASIMKRYSKIRHSYDEYLEDKEAKDSQRPGRFEDINSFDLSLEEAQTQNLTYEELVYQSNLARDMEPFEPDMCEARRILRKIKRKNKHNREINKEKLQLEHELLLKMQQDSKVEKEQEFDKVICEKLLKESNQEKEIAEKIMGIRKQKETMKYNRVLEDELEKQRREEEFIRALFMEDLEARLNFHDERQQLIAEHRILYQRRQALKAAKHEKICREIVEDFVDFALKTAEYHKQYDMEPSTETVRKWKNLFLNQQPILDLIPLEELENPSEDTNEEIYQMELIRQDILDLEDYREYLRYENQWAINEANEETAHVIACAKNVLGYVVHKMLLKKYPIPIPQKPALCPEIEVAVCVNLEDLTKLPYLKRLLALKSIIVVEMEDAVEFCLAAYEYERKTEFDDPFPDADLKEIEPRKKGGGDGKKGKGKKGGKKEKKEKKGKDKKSKGKDKGSVKTVEVIVKDDKQAQTPRLFPWEFLNLTNKARLGKLVKAEKELGHGIDDKILVEMFVEYLEAMPSLKGWVLLNFPNTFYQAALLEQALSGKSVPRQYYDHVINQRSLESVHVEIKSPVRSMSLVAQKSSAYQVGRSLSLKPGKSGESVKFIFKEDEDGSDEELPTLKTSLLSEEATVEEKLSDTELVIDPDDEVALTSPAYERTQKLLPDLVNLAFSSHMIHETNRLQKAVDFQSEQELYTCGCTCAELRELSPEEAAEKEIERAIAELIDDMLFMLENDEQAPPLEWYEMDDKPFVHPIVTDFDRDKRQSQVVPNPRPLETEEYQTILTGYIRTMPKPDEDEEKFKEDEPLPFFAQIEKIDGLQKFYCDQGCYYLLQHEEINSDMIKCLAKMIIGDYSLPFKSSFELFGERYLEAQYEVGDNLITKKGKGKGKEKKKKGKKDKGSKEDKGGKKGGKKDKGKKKGKSDKGSKKSKDSKKGKGKKGKARPEPPKTFEDKEVQYPWVDPVAEEEIIEPKPGEVDWEYVNIPIPLEIEVALGSFWENFEQNYIKDFKNVFHHRRIILTNFVPYLSQVRGVLKTFLKRSDPRDYYLREFQKTLNEIDLNLRDDDKTKQMLNINITEFCNKLLEISDNKMQESEERRTDFICENWLFREICEFIYNGKVAFQLEVDRFMDTLSFLSDYYESLIRKQPSKKHTFFKQILQIESIDENDANEFNKIFLDPNQEFNETIFHTYLANMLQASKIFVDDHFPISYEVIKDSKKLFEVKPKEKKPKGKKKTDVKPFELDEDVKEEADRIYEEWASALTGEYVRAHYTLDLIQMELTKKLEDLIAWIKGIFVEIYELNATQYYNEINSIELACDLLRRSVDEEQVIRPELTFDADSLVALKIALFPEREDYTDGKLKLKQLSYMVNVFLNLADHGRMLEHTFLLLLQDMLYQDPDTFSEELVPPIWRNLTPTNLHKFIGKFFDDKQTIEWKDFVICSLMIPFPTSAELMDTRLKFIFCDPKLSEIVTKEDFASVKMWFENEEEQRHTDMDMDEFDEDEEEYFLDEIQVELSEVKQILFKMYCIDEEHINWTAMLLDFCKDSDRMAGFTKAMELSLGRFFCFDKALGEEFVTDIIETNRLYAEKLEMEQNADVNLAKKAISMMVDDMVGGSGSNFEYQSATITEIYDDQNVPSTIAKMSMVGVKSNMFLAEVASQQTEIESGEFLLDLKYSDSEIGCDARYHTNLAHFLPIEVVKAVICASVPFACLDEDFEAMYGEEEEDGGEEEEDKDMDPENGSFMSKVFKIFKECRSEYFNNAVLVHEFVHNEKLKALFSDVNKFSSTNPVKIMREIMRVEEKEELEISRSNLQLL